MSMTAMMTSCSGEKKAPATAKPASMRARTASPPPFREPVRLSSKDGVLEVRLSAHQGTVNLDTVKEPVTNFLVFGYDLIKGTSSDGSTKGDNIYPAPTLRVDPGETPDSPLRQRPCGPEHPGLLRPSVHSDGRRGSDLPADAHRGAPEPAHPRSARQPVRATPTTCCCRSRRAWATPTPTTFPRRCPTGCTGTTATATR